MNRLTNILFAAVARRRRELRRQPQGPGRAPSPPTPAAAVAAASRPRRRSARRSIAWAGPRSTPRSTTALTPRLPAATAKDAYNQDGSPGGWGQYVPEFMRNLAVLDALDTGLTCVAGSCSGRARRWPGCGLRQPGLVQRHDRRRRHPGRRVVRHARDDPRRRRAVPRHHQDGARSGQRSELPRGRVRRAERRAQTRAAVVGRRPTT